MPIDYTPLQTQLTHQFTNLALLREALRHSSFVNEQPDADLRDNERLEFLGDAVLNLVIGDLLIIAYPNLKEGDLSRMRANLVNEGQLADIARIINLGEFLALGNGEIQSNGREKNSILADAMEAVIASVYLDAGFDAAYQIIRRHFKGLIAEAPEQTSIYDYKSRLQEMAQISFKEVPRYEVVAESGPDHDKTFFVAMTVGTIQAEGSGKNKKAAEQDAACKGLAAIKQGSLQPGIL